MMRLICLFFPALLWAADGAPPPVLWHDPGPLSLDHWRCGPGGCRRTPAPPFQFVKEDLSGTNPKVTVKDSHGLTWDVKFGEEVIPECFASRFVTALGYFAEPTYFVATGKIQGMQKLRRAGRMIKPDGRFAKGRFELRDQPDFVFLANRVWAWDDNPFRGSHELAGLKIVMMLLSNWDAKDARNPGDSNNGVFRGELEGSPAFLYAVFDWGASLGRWGGPRRREKSDCSGFALDTPQFVRAPAPGQLQWGYTGKHQAGITGGITVEDVRWLLPYLTRIPPGQLRAGLEASGATERQTTCWAGALENRIQELRAVAAR